MEVVIDPSAQQAALIERKADEQAIARIIFNPNVGRYDVQADVGPDWGTKRQESANALSLVLTQNPQLSAVIGDLLLKSFDFDLADEAAARLRRLVPPQALGTGPSPNEQALQTQVQQLTELLKESMTELATAKVSLKGKDAMREIDAYKAFTDRLAKIVDAAQKQGTEVDPRVLAELLTQASSEALTSPLSEVFAAARPTLEASARSGNGSAQLALPLGGQS